jgi:cell division protein FtsW
MHGKSGSGERDANRVFFIGMALCLIGLVMLMSTGAFVRASGSLEGYAGDPYRLFKRQAICLVVAIMVYIGLRRISFSQLDRLARPFLVAACVLLVAVLLPHVGAEEGHARRWFRIGPASIQPSEFAKLALILFLAHYLARHRDRLHDFRQGVLPPVFVILVVSGLVALEPDLGTSVLLATIGFMMLLVAGVRVRHLVPFAGVGLPALVGFMAFRFDHVLPRIRAFLNPMECYQTRQSLLALGSGGWHGTGLGEGRQKLAFLPQVHGDFLFASIGEELGLLGCLTVLVLFAAFLFFSARLLGRVRAPFPFFVGVGVTGLIGLQAAMNIAVVTASVPPKGIALPFLSQGGTSLLVMVAGLALLVGVGRSESAGTSLVGGEPSGITGRVLCREGSGS